jgi:hypothetical protein
VQHSESTRHLSPPFTRSATTTTTGALYRRKGAPASHMRLAARRPFAHPSVFRPPSSPRVSIPMAVRYLLLTHGEPCNFIRCVTDDKRPRVHSAPGRPTRTAGRVVVFPGDRPDEKERVRVALRGEGTTTTTMTTRMGKVFIKLLQNLGRVARFRRGRRRER